ncbi:MAG: tRNA (adenosine(37)-N6)-threonylcarbamoyltransferase complex dimerization subunit type 1 TsaB [Eubacteriales bacterium]
MLIFAIDTTATTASAALTEDLRLITQFTLNKTLTHSETLLPMVYSVLNNSHIGIGDIDIFACSAGPGSFTGVRIGVATIKGLAFGSNKSCIGVSTLEALAYNYEGIALNSIVCPVMDARRGQLYNALFSNCKRITPDRAISLKDLADELETLALPVYFTGDGYNLAHENISLPFICNSPEQLRYQSAYSVAAAAFRKYTLTPAPYTDTELSPVYLRPSQAERTADENKKLQASTK